LCVERCPVAAISLHLDTGARVNDDANPHFVFSENCRRSDLTELVIDSFSSISVIGGIVPETDEAIEKCFLRIQSALNRIGVQFPNHLARNLLIGVGVGAGMRRRGDTNVRMDLVLGPPGILAGTGAVEFGCDLLEGARSIIDSVAVLVTRYHFEKDNLVPIVVTLSLPNQRSEYWQLIRDIKDVLGIQINTLTIGALIVMLWSRTRLSFETGSEFYADCEGYSIRSNIEDQMHRKLNVLFGYPGFVESQK